MIRAGWQFSVAIMGNEPADRDTRKIVQQRQNRVEYLSADILEVNIDTVRTGRLQMFSQLGLAMVEAGIETKYVPNKSAFLFATGNADDPAAFDLGDLADDRTDSARGRCDNNRLSGLRFSDVQQTSIRGETRHTEDTECVGKRDERAIDLSRVFTVGQRVFPPTG